MGDGHGMNGPPPDGSHRDDRLQRLIGRAVRGGGCGINGSIGHGLRLLGVLLLGAPAEHLQ